jgi:CheY-like chemotaxis protein
VRLRQVMTNLLTNAVLYNRRDGSVSVGVFAPDEATVRIEVSDTGIGIPADRHAGVFENLNRLGREGGTIKGAGVGLAICKQLIAMMDGKIGFRSQPGVGSTFWIELPKAHAEPKAVVAAGRPGVGNRFADRTILYIEDSASAAMLMQGIMRFLDGVRLRHAATGQEGLSISRRELPDVIVLDIGLPDMDGTEVNRRLKRDPRTAGIPVVALSAAAMPDQIAKAREAGFFDYVTKPFEVRAFMDTLQAALDASPRRAALDQVATGSE